MLQSQVHHAVRQLDNGEWTFVNVWQQPMSGRYIEEAGEPELDLYSNSAYLYPTEELAVQAAERYWLEANKEFDERSAEI